MNSKAMLILVLGLTMSFSEGCGISIPGMQGALAPQSPLGPLTTDPNAQAANPLAGSLTGGTGSDMLVLTGANKLVRAQGAWTKDEEIQAIADHWKRQGNPRFDNRLMAKEGAEGGTLGELGEASEEDEELLQQAIEVIRTTRRASTSMIQRRLRIGYTRAARLVDILEEKGMVGPSRGAEPREILFDIDGFGTASAGADSGDGAPPQA